MSHDYVFIRAELEKELFRLEETDAQEMMESYGVRESDLSKLEKSVYRTPCLQSCIAASHK